MEDLSYSNEILDSDDSDAMTRFGKITFKKIIDLIKFKIGIII